MLAAITASTELCTTALRFASHFANVVGVDDEALVRGWSTRVLWVLCKTFSERGLMAVRTRIPLPSSAGLVVLPDSRAGDNPHRYTRF